MATGKIAVYSLGHSGVVLDKNPLEPSLPMDSLQNAQNAMHDPQAGAGGALRKRQGLRKFTPTTAGGTIFGGIAMPVAGTGGAPAPSGTNTTPGSGATGSTVGSGNGTGAPGATDDGASISGAGSGASAFGGGSSGAGTIFGGKRLLIFGRADLTDSPYNSSPTGNGWYVTTKDFATDTPIGKTLPGPPAAPRRPGLVPAVADDGSIGGVGDQLSCLVTDANNVVWLYYPQNFTDNTLDQRPVIRKTNGAVDVSVCTIPRNPNNIANENSTTDMTQLQSVMCLHAGTDGMIYIAVADKYRNTGSAHPGKVSSAYALDPSTGTLTLVYNGILATDRITLQASLFTVQGQPYVFFLDFIGAPDVSTPQWTVEAFRIGSTGVSGGLLGFTDFNTGNTHFDGGTTMIQFNGRLFVGTRTNSASPAQPELYSRDPTVAIFGSAWTANASIKALLPTASNLSRYTSMCVFNGNLYVGYYDYGTSTQQIFKGVATAPGDPTNTGFTFTQVLSVGSTDPFLLNTDNGILYACKAAGASVGPKLYSSTDGSSWSSATAIPTLSNGSYPLFGLFFGLNQT